MPVHVTHLEALAIHQIGYTIRFLYSSANESTSTAFDALCEKYEASINWLEKMVGKVSNESLRTDGNVISRCLYS